MTCPRCGTETDSWPCPECGFPEIRYCRKKRNAKHTLCYIRQEKKEQSY